MSTTKIMVWLIACFVYSVTAYSQDAAAIDTAKKELSKAKTAAEKVKSLDLLSRMLMNVNLQESEKYGEQLIEIAEESRDRELMVKSYLSNGIRCSYWAGTKDYTSRSLEYYNKALELAKQNKLHKYVVATLIKLAALHLSIPDKDKASAYASQASSKVSVLDNDSLKTLVSHIQGDVTMAKNAKIEALRYYLVALRLAEQLRDPKLIRESYLKLAGFYAGIEDHDRAFDFATLAFNQLSKIDEKNVPYIMITDINTLGNLYSLKKNYELAIKYYQRSVKMADSLKFSNLQVPGYVSLLNIYLMMDKPEKALEFFNSVEGEKLKTFLKNFGLVSVIEQAYAIIYTNLNKLDSAGFYFKKTAGYFSNSSNGYVKMNHYVQEAFYYKKTGENNKAIDLLQEVKSFGEKNGQLELVERSCKYLDTLYNIIGDYKTASIYNSMYHLFKDSLQKTNREKELAQVEAQDEQDRLVKAAELASEKKRQRNNIQYLAITIGIITLFLLLVIFGMLRVSATTIKMVGFFAFLMFFEFIFLIFKKNIYSITKGEPWMDLLFMIGLAAILLPLHHWLEHKVLHLLTTQNRLTTAGSFFRSWVFKKSNQVNDQ